METIEELYLRLNAIDNKLSLLKDKRRKELDKFENKIAVKLFNTYGDTNEAVIIKERTVESKKEKLNEQYGINELRKEHSKLLEKIELTKKENSAKLNTNFMEA